MAERQRKYKNNPANYDADIWGNEQAPPRPVKRPRRGKDGTVRISGVPYAQQRLFSGEEMRIPFPNTPLNSIPDRLGMSTKPGTLFSQPQAEPQHTQAALFTPAEDRREPTLRQPAKAAPTAPPLTPESTRRQAGKKTIPPAPAGEYPSTDSVSALRERIAYYGASTLSNPELLDVILRSAAASQRVARSAQELFSDHHLPQLLTVDFGEFDRGYGLGAETSAKLLAVMEYARRLTLPSPQERYQIRSPDDAAKYLKVEMEHLDHEAMRILLLDSKNYVLANLLKYSGTVNSSVLRGAEIFREAVSRNCPALLVCHNHPSGDPTPSPEDLEVTKQLAQIGKVLDIELVDHLILGKGVFVSLKEQMQW